MSLWEAKEARSRAWADRKAGRISTAELYAVLLDLRRQFGNELYDR